MNITLTTPAAIIRNFDSSQGRENTQAQITNLREWLQPFKHMQEAGMASFIFVFYLC